ncbi:hypothetical protein Tco_0123270 [Tanacetum coccineum]
MEEMLYKFIDEGKHEQEEMGAFIHEFRTTNELLFKERNNSLSELRFEVQGLLRAINNTPISNLEVKGVTTRDMLEDSRVPIILGRPFLATARAMIDVFNKKITLRVGDDEVIFDMDQSIKRSPAKDDEFYGKSIDQSDIESCESSECKAVDDSDSGEPIRHIESVNTPYPVAQKTAEPNKVESEQLYSVSANEIDEKKPELKYLPHEDITYYLVNISKRHAFWSLNEDILKINDSDDQYAISIKDDKAYLMTKLSMGEFKIIKEIEVEEVIQHLDTSLEVFNNEINRLSGMDDDLFTYEVEVANISCDSIMDDDSEQEADDDMGYDPSDVAFIEWSGSKFFNYKTMDHYTMKALWIYWIRGDDEVELTDEESSNDMDEVAEVFRIDTNC